MAEGLASSILRGKRTRLCKRKARVCCGLWDILLYEPNKANFGGKPPTAHSAHLHANHDHQN